MRLVLLILALAATLVLNSAPGAAHRTHPLTEQGCSLYISVPSPCDPDSNN